MRHFRQPVKTGDCGRLRDAVSSPLLAVGSGFALARELKRCIDFCRRNSLLAGVEPIWGYLPVSSPRMRGLPRQALRQARELKRTYTRRIGGFVLAAGSLASCLAWCRASPFSGQELHHLTGETPPRSSGVRVQRDGYVAVSHSREAVNL